MNRLWTFASTIALVAGSISPAAAQTSTSTSGSNSGAVSGSNSASSSNPVNTTTTTTNSTSASGASSTSATNSTASNQGNSQTINNNSNYPANQTVKMAPALVAPALTTTLTETCMGSTSLGVSVLGFGATGGTTWQDHQCARRLNARELAQTMGDRDAARELMCTDEEVFRVYNALGRPCRLKPDGTPNPAYMPPPPPPPAAAPAPVAAMPGPFLVFFDWDKADITPEASATLDKAASAYQQTGMASVQLTGHTDKTGAADYNMALSLRRAESVKVYLAGRGVPRDVMVVHGMGATQPRVQTADGVREVQNRRVEIAFVGPGSAPDTNAPNGDGTPPTEGSGSAKASN
ncbi:MAG TPA: OmpA family protein [Novosphingobium sp.]|nr:OmpA family protein [Novosphingobium sp.]